MLTLLLLLLAGTPPAAATSELQRLGQTLRTAEAWHAEFVQTYTPAGFEEGSTERGTIVLAAPDRLRFEYSGEARRVFAVSDRVARHVDEGTGTCDAVRVDESAWSSMPLAALLEPGAARDVFEETVVDSVLRLTPRRPSPEVALVLVTPAPQGPPVRVVVVDGSGNRNELALSGWRVVPRPAASVFTPALPGQPPCQPEGP